MMKTGERPNVKNGSSFPRKRESRPWMSREKRDMTTPRFSPIAFFLLLTFAFWLSPFTLFAAFEDPYWSARVAAMGGAFTALSDDPTGVFYNGAATVKIKKRQANFSYAKLFTGLDEVKLSLSQFAYVGPLKNYGFVGIGWGNFGADFYREDTVLASYAYDLSDVFEGYEGLLSVGVSMRYLTRRFVIDERTVNDPVFSDGNRTHAAAVDLHWFSKPEPNLFPGLSLGISVKSINQPNVGFKDVERLPREVTGGIAYRWRELSIPIDIGSRAGHITPHLGIERFFMDENLALRLGSDLSEIGTGFGFVHRLSRTQRLVFDYAFQWPLKLKQGSGSHRATVGIKF